MRPENFEVPPGPGLAVDPEWNDWKWQLKNRITQVQHLRKYFAVDDLSVKAAAEAANLFRMAITPYYLKTILSADPEDRDALMRIVLPQRDELKSIDADMADPLHEDKDSPVHGLVHRYPDRVLLLATQFCASYCRFCTRKRLVGRENGIGSRKNLGAAFRYIRENPQIRDVVVSGGDPLTLPDEQIEYILSNLRAIPHVEIIRLGTKAPIYMPQRITESFLNMVRKYHPVWMSVNVTHPAELTEDSGRALEAIADAGIPMGSQTVLLHGINDCPVTMRRLLTGLLKLRIRPYYLYQCDLSVGLEHFRTPVSKGIEIIEHLRGHVSGYAIPTFVVDAPGGGGKIPVQPNYVLTQNPNRVVLRNFEGNITSYIEPEEYQSPCRVCANQQVCESDTGGGVASLLSCRGISLENRAESRVSEVPDEMAQVNA
jgi:lysine 2,3-aminomutase